jgi:heat shock protein HslJ
MACPDLAAESQYLTALGEMTLAEVSGPTLILSNDAGRSMVFTAQE